MLTLLHSRRALRLTAAGRLLPWLGPALRGLVARRFKESVCRFSLAEQQTTWLHCKGCPHLGDCPYGRTFEAEPAAAAARAFAGQDDGTRPLVVAPHFPLPERARPGLAVPVLATFFGPAAAAEAGRFWDAVRLAGREGGLGDDRVGFELEEAGPDRWRWLDLPRDPAAVSGALPLLRVELTAPLLLRRGADEGRRRETLLNPTFGDLFRAGLRAVGALCRGYGAAADADFTALRQAAEAVPTVEAAFRRFEQGKWSNRSRQHGQVQGVTGAAVFGPVPAALARWLLAAGLAHVGLHRVAGAGGWRACWTPDGGATWEEMG
jgi:hypothetical protein